MAVRYSPSLIGGFVLGGILLLVAAVFLFGSGDLFKRKILWVSFFDGTVGGLSEGAPVNFRGVRVGTVTRVALRIDAEQLTARIPVYFEIDPDGIAWVGETPMPSVARAVAAGLRAKLTMQSFVTGQMQMELDLLPDTPANLVGADIGVPEIPSIPSDFEALKQKLSDLPLEELVMSLNRAANGIEQLVGAPELRETMQSLALALIELQSLLANVNLEAQPLMQDLAAAARSLRNMSDQAATSLQSVDAELQATLGDIRKLTTTTGTDLARTLRLVDRVLQQARITLAGIDDLMGEGTYSRQDIEATLQNLAQASASLRAFADTIDRNPNALLFGR